MSRVYAYPYGWGKVVYRHCTQPSVLIEFELGTKKWVNKCRLSTTEYPFKGFTPYTDESLLIYLLSSLGYDPEILPDFISFRTISFQAPEDWVSTFTESLVKKILGDRFKGFRYNNGIQYINFKKDAHCRSTGVLPKKDTRIEQLVEYLIDRGYNPIRRNKCIQIATSDFVDRGEVVGIIGDLFQEFTYTVGKQYIHFISEDASDNTINQLTDFLRTKNSNPVRFTNKITISKKLPQEDYEIIQNILGKRYNGIFDEPDGINIYFI